jgi:hypothetical protein
MESESSLPHSQVPSTCPYPKPDRSSLCPHIPLPVTTVYFIEYGYSNYNEHVNSFKAWLFLYLLSVLTLKILRSAYRVYFLLRIVVRTNTLKFICSIRWLVFLTETEVSVLRGTNRIFNTYNNLGFQCSDTGHITWMQRGSAAQNIFQSISSSVFLSVAILTF